MCLKSTTLLCVLQMMIERSSLVNALLLLSLTSACKCQQVYNFISTSYLVHEGDQLNVTIQRNSTDSVVRNIVILQVCLLENISCELE